MGNPFLFYPLRIPFIILNKIRNLEKVNGRLDPFFIKRNIERIIISGGCRKTRNL